MSWSVFSGLLLLVCVAALFDLTAASGPKDLYKLLGVKKKATPYEIRRAYRKLAMKYHPDRISDPEEKKKAEKKFIEITDAYEVLKDEKKRKEYDQFGMIDGKIPGQRGGGRFPGGFPGGFPGFAGFGGGKGRKAGSDGFPGMGDIFGDVLGKMFGGGGKRGKKKKRGGNPFGSFSFQFGGGGRGGPSPFGGGGGGGPFGGPGRPAGRGGSRPRTRRKSKGKKRKNKRR